MDQNLHGHQKLNKQPNISVSPWHAQQSTEENHSYGVVLMQPAHSDTNVHGNEKIRDYTILSVLTIVFCLLPLPCIGAFALFYARSSQTLLALGKREEALERSIISRNINISAMIIAPIVYGLIALVKIYRFPNEPYPLGYYSPPLH